MERLSDVRRVLASMLLLAWATTSSCAELQIESWELVPAQGSPIAGLRKINAVALGDFNGDARLDIAIVNGDPGALMVIHQSDDGSFTPAPSGGVTVGATASGLLVADVNEDSSTDLVVCYHDRDEVGILLGNGDGTFAPPRMQSIVTRTQGNPHVHNFALGDLNSDGHLDVIVAQADDNAIAWALGDGKGSFTPIPTTFPAGQHPYTILVADFNDDGHLDCAAPNMQSAELTVGLGDGAGSFTAPPGARPRLPTRTISLATGDINGDGHLDLLANSDERQRELALLLGDGKGGFAPDAHTFRAPARCYGQVVADVNGDGRADVIAPCIDRASVLVWFAESAGQLRFRMKEFRTPGTDSQVLAIGDVNADSIVDFVTAGWAQPTVTVLLGTQRDATSE